jgi:hypothetical protein
MMRYSRKLSNGSIIPRVPMNFRLFRAVILGQVYEQFLGKVIRLTPGHQAKVEYKPEVKKAGGVYYTPQLHRGVHRPTHLRRAGEGPDSTGRIEASHPRPACGSGSFLLGAYQFLLDWHLNWYIHNLVPVLAEKSATSPEVRAFLPEPTQKSGKKGPGGDTTLPIYKAANGSASRTRSDWKLTTTERKRILLTTHLRRGYRYPGSGGDQALPAAQGPRGGERGEMSPSSSSFSPSGPFQPAPEYQVRELAHRNGHLRRRAGDPRRPRGGERINAFDWDRNSRRLCRRVDSMRLSGTRRM